MTRGAGSRRSAYLGDGVEVEDDGIQLKLTADGSKVIYLGPEELRALVRVARSWGFLPR